MHLLLDFGKELKQSWVLLLFLAVTSTAWGKTDVARLLGTDAEKMYKALTIEGATDDTARFDIPEVFTIQCRNTEQCLVGMRSSQEDSWETDNTGLKIVLVTEDSLSAVAQQCDQLRGELKDMNLDRSDGTKAYWKSLKGTNSEITCQYEGPDPSRLHLYGFQAHIAKSAVLSSEQANNMISQLYSNTIKLKPGKYQSKSGIWEKIVEISDAPLGGYKIVGVFGYSPRVIVVEPRFASPDLYFFKRKDRWYKMWWVGGDNFMKVWEFDGCPITKRIRITSLSPDRFAVEESLSTAYRDRGYCVEEPGSWEQHPDAYERFEKTS